MAGKVVKNIKINSKSIAFSFTFRLSLVVFLVLALAPAMVLTEDAGDVSGDSISSSESSSDTGSTGAAIASEPGCSDLESSGSETETAAASQNTGEDGFYPLLWWQVGDDDTYTRHMADLTAPSPDLYPGFVDVIGWGFTGSYDFRDLVAIPAFAGKLAWQ